MGDRKMNSQNNDLYKALVWQRAELMGFALCIPELNFEKVNFKLPIEYARLKDENLRALAGKEIQTFRFFDDKNDIDISIVLTRDELDKMYDEEAVAKILTQVVKSQRELVDYYIHTRGFQLKEKGLLPSTQRMCIRHLRNAYLNWYGLNNKRKVRQKYYQVDNYLKNMKLIEAVSFLPATEMLHEMMSMPATVPTELIQENVSRFSHFLAQRPEMTHVFYEQRMKSREADCASMFIVDTLRGRFVEAKYDIGATPLKQMQAEEELETESGIGEEI